MKRLIPAVVVGVLSLGFAGCSDTSTAERKTTVTTPEGKTTVTTKQEIKKSGENPPPAAP